MAVTDRIATAEVAHFDETGFRAAGKLHWLHSASTSLWTLITCHPRRGREAMNAAGVLPDFTGIAVHDAWTPYDTFPQLTHSLCNAHVLRELIAVTDHHRAHATEKDSWCWAGKVIDNLLATKKLTETGLVPVDPERLAHHRSLMVHAARIGIIDSPLGKVGNKHRALARRINSRIQDYLRFATDPHAPFDNNAAEREIRMAKLRQKISGGMRTLTGAEDFAALRSYIATTAKTGSTDSTHSPNSSPENPGSQPPPDQLRYRKLEKRELLAKVKKAAEEFDLGNEPDSGRPTFPGFLPKLMLARFGGAWYQPLRNSHSTHSVKPEPAKRPVTIYDEYYSHQLARAMGLSSFSSELVTIDHNSQFLAMERYDRKVLEDGTVVALHQEDAAQALGIDWVSSQSKFQDAKAPNLRGRPSAKSNAEIFGTIGDGADIRIRLQHLLFSLLVGNRDGHAKNVSIIHDGGESRIADLYDAVPIVHINDDPDRVNSAKIDDNLSLSIGGEFAHHSVTLDHFRNEAKSWGAMGARTVDRTMTQTLEQFSGALETVPEVPGGGPKLRNRLGYNLDRISSSQKIGKPKFPLPEWKPANHG